MSIVGISGNIQRIQSSIDFYLKITSVKDVSSVEQLRKFYYDKFMEEEESRATYSMEFPESEKLENENSTCSNVKSKEYLKEDKLEDENNYLSEEELNQKIKTIIESEKISEIQQMSNIEYAESGVILEEVQGRVVTNKDSIKENINYVSEGVDLDKEDYEDTDEVDEVESEDIDEANDYTITIEIPDEDNSNNITEDVEYVSEGVILEDIPDLSSTEVGLIGGEEDEEIISLSNEKEELEVGRSNNKIDSEEDIFNLLNIEEEELVDSSTEGGESIEETEDDFFESVLDSDCEYVVDDFESDLIVVEEPAVEKPSKTVEKDIMNIPRDIRDFLRAHPNSSIDFVSEYYPMKEINKQIQIGRIFSKKGKLMI